MSVDVEVVRGRRRQVPHHHVDQDVQLVARDRADRNDVDELPFPGRPSRRRIISSTIGRSLHRLTGEADYVASPLHSPLRADELFDKRPVQFLAVHAGGCYPHTSDT